MPVRQAASCATSDHIREGRPRVNTTSANPKGQPRSLPAAFKSPSPGRNRDFANQSEPRNDSASEYQPSFPVQEPVRPGGDVRAKKTRKEEYRAGQTKAGKVSKPEATILSMQPDSSRQSKRKRGDLAINDEAVQTSRQPPKKKKRQGQDNTTDLRNQSLVVSTSGTFKSSGAQPRTVRTYRRKGRTSSPVSAERNGVDFDEIPAESEPVVRRSARNGKPSQLACKATPVRERQTRNTTVRNRTGKRQPHDGNHTPTRVVGEAKSQPRSGGSGIRPSLPVVDAVNVDQPSTAASPHKKSRATVKEAPVASGGFKDAKARANATSNKVAHEDKGYSASKILEAVDKSLPDASDVVLQKAASTKSAEDHFTVTNPIPLGDSVSEDNDQHISPGELAKEDHVEYSVSLKGSESSGTPIVTPARQPASHSDVVMIDLTQEDSPKGPQESKDDLRYQPTNLRPRTSWDSKMITSDKAYVAPRRLEEQEVAAKVSQPVRPIADRVATSDNVMQPLDTGVSTDDSRATFDSTTLVDSSQFPAGLNASGYVARLRLTHQVPTVGSPREQDVGKDGTPSSHQAYAVDDKRKGPGIGMKMLKQSRYNEEDKRQTSRIRPSHDAHSKHAVALEAQTVLNPPKNTTFIRDAQKASQEGKMQGISEVLGEIHQVILDGISSKFKDAKKDVIRGRQRIVEEAGGDIRTMALDSAHHFNS
ncbi:hypothetical protein CONPUDRAFT_162490, partial [Coniophora puteana RWD-64-598 SS2]